MITVVCAVRDAKTEVFSQPMFFITKGVAVRSFSDEVANPQSSLNKHPHDYAMFHIGYFDDQKGTFENLVQPVEIALAKDYLPN